MGRPARRQVRSNTGRALAHCAAPNAPHATMARKSTGAAKLYDIACDSLPVESAAKARVMPHSGHGNPVRCNMGQVLVMVCVVSPKKSSEAATTSTLTAPNAARRPLRRTRCVGVRGAG